MDPIVLVLIGVSILISVYAVFRLHMTLAGIRSESKKSFEIASRVVQDWEEFSTRHSGDRQRMEERLERFETTTRDRVDQFEGVAAGTRDRLIKLEQYLKEFFEVELKTVFDSFDKTVTAILEEMKVELLRGVDRIEEIQAVVDSKSLAQDRILDGEGSVYRMLANTDEGGEDAPPESPPGDGEPAPDSLEDDAENPPFRIDGEDLE